MNQSYVFVQQLDHYSNQSIIITINRGYIRYKISRNFFKISLVNESEIGQINKTSGFKVNGHSLTYKPCGNNPHRSFIFYQTLLNSSSVKQYQDKFLNFINLGIESKSKNICPQNFFYTVEYHMADCGCLTLSIQNKTEQAYAFAFGLK